MDGRKRLVTARRDNPIKKNDVLFTPCISAEFSSLLKEKIFTIPFFLSQCSSVQEAGQCLCNLAATNRFLNNLINDREVTLAGIKQLSQQFKETNIDVAMTLCTQEANHRYLVQLGFDLSGWDLDSSMRRYANKLKTLGLDTNFFYKTWYPSPLYQACYNNPLGFLMAARWLLENGADPNICHSQNEKNAVMVFLERNNNTAMLVLPNAGFIGIKQSETTSLLYSLINHPKLSLDHQDSDQNTLLHYCLLNYASAIIATIRQLTERGANPTIKNKHGKTPLDYAKEIEGKDIEDVIELLTQAEIDFNSREK